MSLLKNLAFLFVLLTIQVFSQEETEEPSIDWHFLDSEENYIPGIALNQAYQFLKFNKLESNTVIVAVLDSGLDIHHEDIKSVLWKNEKEIKGNNIDDDENGYIDDVNGWNFIGGLYKKSVRGATLESTRLYKSYKKKFDGKNRFNIAPEEKADFIKYVALMKLYEEGKKSIKVSIEMTQEEIEFFEEFVPQLQEAVGKKVFTKKELEKVRLKETELKNKRERFLGVVERNQENHLTTKKLLKHYNEVTDRMKMLEKRLEYNFSLDYDDREIIGDHYSDLHEKKYGNNDVTVRSSHGTHVAGIIGAKRNNGIGIDGVADNVLLMPIRNTPMGDEYDKDVANGIRYAVDNGAKIINMSFGKQFSPEKEIVDEAVKYAEEKGVLIVHGAGNDGINTDYYYSYPSPLLLDGTVVSNWIEVGATSYSIDKELVADFSNYGKASVDVFAPGVNIYSTIPNNQYDIRSGTSMASPVVAGVAALLFSYFPELTPQEVKSIIVASGEAYETEVFKPGSEEKVPFSSLSKSGKIVNAFNAVKLALEKREE